MPGDEQQVRLDDVELCKDDVERRHEDPSNRMLLRPRPDEEVEIAENRLVPDVRRRRHRSVVIAAAFRLKPEATLTRGQPHRGSGWGSETARVSRRGQERRRRRMRKCLR